MQSIPHPTSEPSVLLLNEIDILLAQTRLVELYLKQAQASSATDASRSHQQHQAELARLRTELTDSKRTLEQHAAAQTADLASQLKDKQEALDRCVKELETARGEIAVLRERQSATERAKREADEEWQRSGSSQRELEARLQAKTDELARLELDTAEMRDQLSGTIKVLEQQYQDEIALLRHQLERRETARVMPAQETAGKAAPQHPGTVDVVPQTVANNVTHLDFTSSRRWQSRFVAKRRWNA